LKYESPTGYTIKGKIVEKRKIFLSLGRLRANIDSNLYKFIMKKQDIKNPVRYS
jgi:hypothetical protein